MFVEDETRKQNELTSPANKPLLSLEHPQSSSYFLACQALKDLEKTKLGTTLLPPTHPCFSACLL